jgi:hypothetical protein
MDNPNHAIHANQTHGAAWMPGTDPGMTKQVECTI